MLRMMKQWIFRDSEYLKNRFTTIYQENIFGGKESKSGEGSNLEQTEVIRKEIPALLKELGVNTFLDAPCGDFFWMSTVDLPPVEYIGVDIVKELIEGNNATHGKPGRKFLLADIVESPLPASDLIHCRDCLVHLSFNQAKKVIANFKRSGATYLLTTTFTERTENRDLGRKDIWRPLNLQLSPFNLPEPLRLINEHCTEAGGNFSDKCLGLWKLNDIS